MEPVADSTAVVVGMDPVPGQPEAAHETFVALLTLDIIPEVPLRRLVGNNVATVLVKLEHIDPTWAYKDRIE